jgi:predicted nucleotidyltransferase
MSREEILKILKAFKEECAGRYGILTLGVFGSVARDDVKEASDVDVVLRTKTPDPYNIVHIKEDLEQRLNVRVDLVRLRDRMNPSLAKRIEVESIYV